MNVELVGLQIADAPESWTAAGFAVVDGTASVGGVRLELVGRGAGQGVVAWSLDGLPRPATDIDGVRITPSVGSSDTRSHPNGAIAIDHIVLMTPHLARTQAALADQGFHPRRTRQVEMFGKPIEQVFYRFTNTVLEVIGEPAAVGDGPANIWGITFTVADIEAAATQLGEGVGRVKDAVQPGRRITTLRGRAYEISVPVAFLSPRL